MRSSNGRRVVATMPSLTSYAAGRLLEQVAAAGGGDPAVGGDGDAGPVAARLVEAHDEVARAVVGELHGVDLDAGAGDRRRPVPAATAAPRRRRTTPHRQVEPLGLGDDVGEAGAVREQAHRHVVAALVGVGSG